MASGLEGDRKRVPAACVECRRRHVRCKYSDGGDCSRCQKMNIRCVFEPTRDSMIRAGSARTSYTPNIPHHNPPLANELVNTFQESFPSAPSRQTTALPSGSEPGNAFPLNTSHGQPYQAYPYPPTLSPMGSYAWQQGHQYPLHNPASPPPQPHEVSFAESSSTHHSGISNAYASGSGANAYPTSTYYPPLQNNEA